MIGKPSRRCLAWTSLTAASCLFAGWIAFDTLRTIVSAWSPLPWFDSWATVDLLRAWRNDELTTAAVLFRQSNEHRILVPRLVFFADDASFRGEGYLSLAAIFVVQALHAGIHAALLNRSGLARHGGWAVAAVVLAMMFSLRQAENFSSGFQLQFVAVFAGATLSFALFGLVVARSRRGAAVAWPLAGSLAAVLMTTFTMANGLVAAVLLVVLAIVARQRRSIVLVCAAWACLLVVVYLHDYTAAQHHGQLSDNLRRPVALARYGLAYLGGIADTGVGGAILLGVVGVLAMLAAAIRVCRRRGARPDALALVGVMAFVAATAAVTATGRLDHGVSQALASRYATGSATFWAAQISYWWIDPPAWPNPHLGPKLARPAILVACLVLCFALSGEQRSARLPLAAQGFAQNDAANLFMLGLHDPAVAAEVAWSDADVQRLLPVMRDDRSSIFATPDFESIGRSVADRGSVASPDPCGGAVGDAVADPTLGQDGVRLSGTAWDGSAQHLIRRIVVADATGKLVGLGSGAVPGAGPSAWRGFAVAPRGTALTAYGSLPGRRLCRVGEATVTAGSILDDVQPR